MKIEVKIEPLPQSRPRFGKGRAYEEPRMKAYKAEITTAARQKMSGREPLTNAISVQLRCFRKYKTTSRRYGDADNHAKAILYACNGVLWSDDSLITSLSVEKHQGEPRVEIEVTEQE